jgi:hypothetical protein
LILLLFSETTNQPTLEVKKYASGSEGFKIGDEERRNDCFLAGSKNDNFTFCSQLNYK